jgi:asparagine synthase (glutamine-hydrolysing)
MCGIAGLFGLAGQDIITRMSKTMTPRGPDDHGFFVDEENQVSLAHRRLSILDLTSAGHQPMNDSSGRYVIVYNGEVYNFRELKQELEDLEHSFKSHTDTEVILHAYMEWGPDCVRRFRGMFAFAILDRGLKYGHDPRNTSDIPSTPYLFLARDRFGIKPFIYSFVGDNFIFASEIKALLASGLVERKIETSALMDYLGYGSVFQPKTILKNVSQLEPGTGIFVYEYGKKSRSFRYWDLVKSTKDLRRDYAQRDYADHVQHTRKLLEEATQYHLVADVPVGAFLSGGVDSTAVAALMGKQTSKPIMTFSVGFEHTKEVSDELSFAKKAAKFLGCEHTEVIVTPRDIAGNFDRIIAAIDQPSIDGTNTYLVSQATSKSVKVAISGLGGDELFAGYPHFKLYQESFVREASVWDQILSLLHTLRPNRFTLNSVYFTASPGERLAMVRRLFTNKRLKTVANEQLAQFVESEFRQCCRQQKADSLTPIARMSLEECKRYLLSTLLRDNDVMSMAHSLEVRPVLLDHVLAEHAFALSDNAKIRVNLMKAALVDAVKDLIPEECWTRPKMGFEMPFATWMNGVLQERVRACFESKKAEDVFSKGYRKKMQHMIKTGRIPRVAWAWFILLEWMIKTDCEICFSKSGKDNS